MFKIIHFANKLALLKQILGIFLFSLSVLSVFVEEPPVRNEDVVGVAQVLNLLAVDSDDLREVFGSKDWISHAVFLFNKQINFHGSLSLKEYFW